MQDYPRAAIECGANEIQIGEFRSTPQEKEEARRALRILARFFPVPAELYSSNDGHYNPFEAPRDPFKKNRIISKMSTIGRSSYTSKKRRVQDHKPLLEQRREIQTLLDYQSTRIEVHEYPSQPFSKHPEIANIYQLIILDKKPIDNLIICKQCRKILVRYRPSSTNLIRHFQRHIKFEEEEKVEARREACKVKGRKDPMNN